MANINSLANEIANDLTTLIKAEIQAKGLVKTGTLLNSIKANVVVSGLDFEIKISGEDYFKYLNEEYKIMDSVKANSGYKNIKDKIAKLYAELIKEQIKKK